MGGWHLGGLVWRGGYMYVAQAHLSLCVQCTCIYMLLNSRCSKCLSLCIQHVASADTSQAAFPAIIVCVRVCV